MRRVKGAITMSIIVLSTTTAGAQPAPIHEAGEAPALQPAPPPAPPPLMVARLPEPPKNGLHVNPLGMLFGVFGLGYERVLHDRVAIQLSGQYTKMWYSDDDVWAIGAQLRPYFFFFRPAPGGMYISPLASIAYSSVTVGSATGSGVGYSVGATIGYSWVIGRHFNIRAGGGVQYMSIRAEAEGDGVTATAGYSGVLPALDLSMGFVF